MYIYFFVQLLISSLLYFFVIKPNFYRKSLSTPFRQTTWVYLLGAKSSTIVKHLLVIDILLPKSQYGRIIKENTKSCSCVLRCLISSSSAASDGHSVSLQIRFINSWQSDSNTTPSYPRLITSDIKHINASASVCSGDCARWSDDEPWLSQLIIQQGTNQDGRML